MNWTFDRIFGRSVCFAGGGGGGVEETEAERASAEIAMKNYNDYMETISPFTDKYIEDVSGDTTAKSAQMAGMVNADLAQSTGTVSPGANGMMPSGAADYAKTLAASQVKGQQAIIGQKADALQSVIDIGQGTATEAQKGMSELASQSVSEATSNAAAEQAADDATASAGATAVGMSMGIGKNMFDDYYKSKE